MNREEMSERNRIEMLLPFYDSDDLDAEERAFVDRWLAQHPDAPGALEAVRLEREATNAVNEDIVVPADASRVLDKILDSQTDTVQTTRPERSAGWKQSLASIIPDWLLPTPGGAVAFGALLLAALVVQNLYLSSTRTPGTELAGQQAGTLNGIRLIVEVSPDTTIRDLTELLRRADAMIVSGPKAGMLFEIVVHDNDADTLETRVRTLQENPSFLSIHRMQSGSQP